MENKVCYLCGDTNEKNLRVVKRINTVCTNCYPKSIAFEIDPMIKKEYEIENINTVINIVSWNWQFDTNAKKYIQILKYHPQVLIIQECTKNDFDYIKNMWKYKNWYNDDLNNEHSPLGVAIFSNDYKIEFTNIFNRKFRYIIPYYLSNEKYKFTLFSVWTKPEDDSDIKYNKYLNKAIDFYQENRMIDDHTIFIGDFNTFANKNNNNLKELEEKFDIVSMINSTVNTEFNKKYTYYHGKDKHGVDNYGINDFCFVSKYLKNKYDIELMIDLHNEWDDKEDKKHHWKGLSDHCPISLSITLKENNNGIILDINSEESIKKFEEWYMSGDRLNV
ncbi:hypothetical protein R84B8_02192 [Treponema sp. R8-4-B8]